MKYIMEIKPALEPKERHQIQDHLTWLGYHVSGGGTCTDMSSCDISFDKEGAFETMDLRQRWIDEVTILKDKLVKTIPAPSMAEAWRRLPGILSVNKRWYELRFIKVDGITHVGYWWSTECLIRFQNINPTDALIDLLIWVEQRKEEGK